MEWLFIKGLLVGFAIAAPVGPIGILCIGRTLSHGRLKGLATGIGAAVADALYGAVAGFGLTAIDVFLREQLIWLRVVGGVVLCFMGYKILRSKPAEQSGELQQGSVAGAFLSALVLTLTNPMTLLSFAAIFTGLRINAPGTTPAHVGALIGGVFTGSALWWIFLSLVAGLFRKVLTPAGLHWINIVSGAVIIAFGIFALYFPMGG